MKQILIIHLNDENNTNVINFLNEDIRIQRKGCGGDPEIAKALIAEYDGQVDAIGLDGLPAKLELGSFSKPHIIGQELAQVAEKTAVVDGSGIRAGLRTLGRHPGRPRPTGHLRPKTHPHGTRAQPPRANPGTQSTQSRTSAMPIPSSTLPCPTSPGWAANKPSTGRPLAPLTN